MDTETDPAPKTPRPYFIPPSINYDALPQEVQIALTKIVAPMYERLVVHAASELERSAGMTLTFLETLEVLDQFRFGRDFDFGVPPKYVDLDDRAKQIARHLRLISSKQTQHDFLLKLYAMREKYRRNYFP
jgi:hypothetical protein